jgi:hypothetical protein
MKRINVGRGYVEKYMFFLGPNSTYFTFYIHLWEVPGLNLGQVSVVVKSPAISLSSKQVIMPYKSLMAFEATVPVYANGGEEECI